MSPPSLETNTAAVLPQRLAWGLLIAFLVMAVPLFVASPVTSDTSLFDVQAMTVLKGGVLYRDALEPNLPGIVWLHLAVRSVIGWSSEAIRIFDLLMFGATLMLFGAIARCDRSDDSTGHALPLFGLIFSLFYLTRNEWCHCQRDIWMMVPVSLALWLRIRRVDVRLRSAVVEGMIWAVAFWIKPHVAIPAAAVLAVDIVRRADSRAALRDISGMLLGGILMAIPGMIWLVATGTWDHFWTMMLEWNPEYLATGKSRRTWERLGFLAARFWPWWLVHLVAVPIGVRHLLALRHAASRREHSTDALIAACYLAWLIQTCALQHAMDYIHVPEVLLAFCVLARHPWRLDWSVRRCAVAALLLLGVMNAPQFRNNRLAMWPACWTEGSTPKVRAVLAQGNLPDWIHLDRVRSFLAEQQAGDGDVTCLNVHSIHLHQELGILPASRYWCISHPLTMYPSRYDEIMTAVRHPAPRFVVVDERETALPDQILPDTFPTEFPVVFESGTYRVYSTRPSGGKSGRRDLQQEPHCDVRHKCGDGNGADSFENVDLPDDDDWIRLRLNLHLGLIGSS